MPTRLRLTLTAAVALAPLVPLTLRLIELQVLKHRALDSRAAGEFERVTKEFAARGDIVDRNDNTLAHSVPSWSCFIDKAMLKNPLKTAARLSPILGQPAEELLRKFGKTGRFLWLKSGLSYDCMTQLAAARIESLGLVESQERVYPNEDLGRNILGGVSNDGPGASGIEWAFDKRLTGRARRFKVVKDGLGRAIYKEAEGGVDIPSPLKLTIDRNIQYYSEEALREASLKYSMKGGMIAVQDPSTGEILALASHPTQFLRNPLIQDTFEPGSTFKLISAAAALEESLMGETETIFCENGSFTIAPGVVIHDHEPAANLTLTGILARSSNIGIAKLAARIGAVRFYRYSRAFGFAGKTGISLPGESAGRLKPVSDLSPVTLAASSYGYGVGATPLQILGAYSTVANGGTLWEPSIVVGPKPAKVRRAISEKTASVLGAMLEEVVKSGTGAAARIEGYRVAGKTGTSRKLDPLTKEYSTTKYMASFVGFVPVSRPRLTILVILDEPTGQYYGSQVAAPIFARLAQKLLVLKGVSPDAETAPSGPVRDKETVPAKLIPTRPWPHAPSARGLTP